MSGLVDDHRNCPYEDVFGNSAQIELLLERGSICLNASTLPAMSAEAGAVKEQLEEVQADPMDMPLIWLCPFSTGPSSSWTP